MLIKKQSMGMSSTWIDRDGDEEKLVGLSESVNFTWRFATMGEMAEAVEKAFQAEGKGV